VKSSLPPPLPVAQWPHPEQVAWASALGGDPLEPGGGGRGAAWRPSTARFNATQYGGWLAWLIDCNDLQAGVAPASRASRTRVRSYLDALEAVGLADYTRAGRLQGLAAALRVMDPGADVKFIGRAAGRISSVAKRARDLRPRLRPPVEVLAFGLELMSSAEDPHAEFALVDRAYAFRDGLLIALWTHRPLRIANLAAIELDGSLLRIADGYRLAFEHDGMKGGRPFGCAWPAKLVGALDRYLETYRPILLSRRKGAGEDKALWISQYGKAMAQGSVGQVICLRTEARFGEPLNPHLMRYLTATFYAEHEPEQIADIPAMLHHASLETSEDHYILGNSLRAIAKFQEVLIAARRAPRTQ
jgi:integrase